MNIKNVLLMCLSKDWYETSVYYLPLYLQKKIGY